jgi:hypothetical protein
MPKSVKSSKAKKPRQPLKGNRLPLEKFVSNLPRSSQSEYVEVKDGQALVPTAIQFPHPVLSGEHFSRLIGSSIAMGFAGFTPLPHMLKAKMKYCQYVSLTASSGILAKNVFVASSVYDPDYTGSGHQPRGFDQLMPLYDHFVVLKSRIEVDFLTVVSNPQIAGVQVNAVTTPETSFIDYAEQARCETAMLPSALTSGGVYPVKMVQHYDAREFMGIPDPITAGKLQGTIIANPADNAFYHVWVQEAAESGTCGAGATVLIEYEVAFIEPLAVARS